METTYNFIRTTLVDFHKTCTTDSFGQVSIFNFRVSLFGDRKDEVEQYCKENNVLEFSTYGGRLGTYRAFRILDQGIREACQEALRTNEHYINNVNRW